MTNESASEDRPLVVRLHTGCLRYLCFCWPKAGRRAQSGIPQHWPGLGLLGEPRNTPQQRLTALAYPLLDKQNAIEEDGGLAPIDDAEEQQAPFQTPPQPGACSPFSPGTPATREGVWSAGLDMRIIIEPAPPFRIAEASPDWLAFCGFDAAQIRGRTLRVIQGSNVETHCIQRLANAARLGRGASVTITNYTKHLLAFRNSIDVSPIMGAGGLLRGFEVRTVAADTSISPLNSWAVRMSMREHPGGHSSLHNAVKAAAAAQAAGHTVPTVPELSDGALLAADSETGSLGFKRARQLSPVTASLDALHGRTASRGSSTPPGR